MKATPVQQRRLSDDIVERIEALILEGSFQAGERLPAERALAEEFGVSRPSLREAIQKLVARGLLISRHGGGTFVSESLGSSFRDPMVELLEHNPEAQRDLIEFRHTLEGSCAYYAALRATEPDRERLKTAFERVQDSYLRQGRISRAEEGRNDALFHLAIAEASHNAVLLLRSPSETGAPVQVAATPTNADDPQDPFELLAAGEDLALATEADLEFYAWVELAMADDGVG